MDIHYAWSSSNMQDAAVDFFTDALIFLRAFHRNEPPYPVTLDLVKVKSFELDTKVPAVRTRCMEHRSFMIEHTVINITFPRLDQFSLYRVGSHREAGRVIGITSGVEKDLLARGLAVRNGSTFPLTSQTPDIIVISTS
jgi:hypothetical protein